MSDPIEWHVIDYRLSPDAKTDYESAYRIDVPRLRQALLESQVEVKHLKAFDSQWELMQLSNALLGCMNGSVAQMKAEIERLKNPWRPIENAPRDETTVDLLVKYTSVKTVEFRIPDCWYCPEEKAWVRSRLDGDGIEMIEDEKGVEVTHYAPIPAPPEGKQCQT